MFYPVLLASLLGARLLVTHRTVSALLPAPSLCYVLTHHPHTQPSSLTSLSLFPIPVSCFFLTHSLDCLASVSRPLPCAPFSLRPLGPPLFRACSHPPLLSIFSDLLVIGSASLYFFSFSPGTSVVRGAKTDVSKEKVLKVEEEVME